MAAPQLIIKKRMQLIQGKVRACCTIQAIVEPRIQAALEEHFQAEALFKRASYSAAWPQGALPIPAAIAPSVAAFLKNDACPEITVKTLLAGQMHQGASVWEMMTFEFIGKLAFENFVAMTEAVGGLGRDVVYTSAGASVQMRDRDGDAFDADTAAEMQALEGADLAA